MAYYLFKIIREGELIESEGSATDMASMIDELKDQYGKDEILFMYVEEQTPKDLVDIPLLI